MFAVIATVIKMCGPVAQWIRHLTTNQGIPGSSPGGVVYFCFSSILNIKRLFNDGDVKPSGEKCFVIHFFLKVLFDNENGDRLFASKRYNNY